MRRHTAGMRSFQCAHRLAASNRAVRFLSQRQRKAEAAGKEAGDRTDVSREFAPFIAQGIDGKPRILSTPNGFASGGEKGTAADIRSECFMLIACLLNLRFG